MSVIVREIEEKDRKEIEEIVRKCFGKWDQYWALQGLNYTKVFVAELKSRPVGFAETYVTAVKGIGKVGVIYYLAVSPDYRRRGIAKSLIFRAEKYFKLRGALLSTASTRHDNLASRRLFKSMGYKELVIWKSSFNLFAEKLTKALYAYEDDIIFYKKL